MTYRYVTVATGTNLPSDQKYRWMMVDSGLAVERQATANVSPEKDREVNGDYTSGGWKSMDASWQCGYASFKGKRPSMEDNYDHKSAEIDGNLISLFGIFDGHGGPRASEYLKEHLFNNLTKHPLLMVDTKVAISETFKRTDSDFLASESNTTRDDGSTASTAVLIGKQLFVANVGDSRAVICKAGKDLPPKVSLRLLFPPLPSFFESKILYRDDETTCTPSSPIFEECVAPLVDGLFQGYNAIVLAYGQTGEVEALKNQAEFQLRVSFIEILKKVSDLLNSSFVSKIEAVNGHSGKLTMPGKVLVRIRWTSNGAITLAGSIFVSTQKEMASCLEQGSLNQATGSTNMNNQSSHSHAIFTITLEQMCKIGPNIPVEGTIMEDMNHEYLCAKLHLVDFANLVHLIPSMEEEMAMLIVSIPLSDDHKPNRSDERKRIEDAGGIVMWAGESASISSQRFLLCILQCDISSRNLSINCTLIIFSRKLVAFKLKIDFGRLCTLIGTWRVGGILAMSRAFGNRLLKQFVLAEPEIQEQLVDEELEFLVLASDGLWDVVPNEDAVSLVRMEEEPEAAARKLTETAFARGSSDNITCIVVRFLHGRMEVTPLSVTQDQCVPCGGSQDGC
ncbi:hypothetical protein ZIOFF_075397 [Zingiber officinale]|uniref:protein-serine/threonine phosphatase n=1 Tax=Zingiber officinale TaxID=94328 RepID=A0A8J5C4I7_ZINOF|nr:hypothetical protein ZIOFF_075397 [Zingiber officinale]